MSKVNGFVRVYFSLSYSQFKNRDTSDSAERVIEAGSELFPNIEMKNKEKVRKCCLSMMRQSLSVRTFKTARLLLLHNHCQRHINFIDVFEFVVIRNTGPFYHCNYKPCSRVTEYAQN